MIIAVDTGGTKTLIAAFDESGQKTILDRTPTPRDSSEYIKKVSQTISAYDSADIYALVVAAPGMIDGGVVKYCPNIGWQSFDLVAQLQAVLPHTKIWLENDANLAGLSEVRSRPDAPKNCLYLTISTGIGSGIIIDGEISPELRLSEAGHALLEYDGKLQEWEKFASGSAIVRDYQQMAKDITEPVTWRQICQRISRGFLAIIPILQPELIIIGGSVGIYFDRYQKILTDILVENLPKNIDCPPIEKAKHPDEAVIYGCYYYGIDKIST